jgi:ankyrin repeat protein/catechol 2,3-dioxygenase-like lactoylglutathione lyase family enzyme
VDRRRSPTLEAFFAACAGGDVRSMRDLLGRDPTLVRERTRGGDTPLHLAVHGAGAVRLLLEHGADPNARDASDHALPLHRAAGGGPLDAVRALLDAGSDVHRVGDAHRLEVIGWATVFDRARQDVVDLLVERGARHHVFSATALGDLDLLQRVVEDDPEAIGRRLARSEQEQTALHYVIAPPDGLVGGLFRTGQHFKTLDLLIELSADLEARDAKGRTPLAVAMLRGDHEAMRRLHAAGAATPVSTDPQGPPGSPGGAANSALAASPELAASISKLTPMLGVPEMQATVAWYRSIGFVLAGSHGDNGRLDWASVRLGQAQIMFTPSGQPWRGATVGLSLWLRTDRLDELYARFKGWQLERAQAALAGEATEAPEVQFTQDLYTAFYGQREFCIRDPNGVELNFFQPAD